MSSAKANAGSVVVVQARAYLLKQIARDAGDGPPSVLAEGAAFDPPRPGAPPGVWVATRAGEEDSANWRGLVDQATDQSSDLKTLSTPGAAFVVWPPDGAHPVAFCFGSGRFLLRRGSYVTGFGMRASLNAAVESGDKAVESIGWVSYRTGEAKPVDGRLRGTAPKTLGGYGVAPGLDRIRGVRVQALDKKVGVGRSLEGSTSLGVDIGTELRELPGLAARLVRLGLHEGFRDKWPHVDDLIEVEDVDKRHELDQALLLRLTNRSFESISLGLPDEADGFTGVRYGSAQELFDSYDIELALRTWRGGLSTLKSREVEFVFDDGRPPHSHQLYDLLVAVEVIDGEEVHLTDGSWFQVGAGLLEVVDGVLDGLPSWEITLPLWARAEKKGEGTHLNEGDYLSATADKRRPDLLLMDRKNVTTGGGTAMEVCDLAHQSGAMVHVKKLDTKGISHLANQIQSSAVRWAREIGYRDAVLARIVHQAQTSDKDVEKLRQQFDARYPRNGDHPQVLGIATTWNGRTLSQAVSTLGKLQLHRAVAELETRGFDVRISMIELA